MAHGTPTWRALTLRRQAPNCAHATDCGTNIKELPATKVGCLCVINVYFRINQPINAERYLKKLCVQQLRHTLRPSLPTLSRTTTCPKLHHWVDYIVRRPGGDSLSVRIRLPGDCFETGAQVWCQTDRGNTRPNAYARVNTDIDQHFCTSCPQRGHGARIVHTKPPTHTRTYTVATEGDDMGS